MWARLVNALRVVFRRTAVERDLEEELRFHVDMQVQQNLARGMTLDEAREAAYRSFGGYERVKEQCRDARGARFMEMLAQDLRFAGRTLRANPGFTLVAVLTLGLGIGANTAIFSVINGVLLRPLPYADEARLVLIRQAAPLANRPLINLSIREYFDYREQGTADFEALVEYHQMNFDLLNRGEPDRVNTGVVSHNFFDVLGITPLIGRTFRADDDRPGAEPVLLLSYSYWQSKFGGDPSIVGQVFEMNDKPHSVVGVLPNVPHYPAENDVYMPVLACPFRAAAERNIAQNRRIFSALTVFGHLKPGVTRARAASGVEAICRRFTSEHPVVYRTEQTGFQATALDVRGELTRNARPMLLILMGATGLILLIACANVANLTLARLLRRDREMALRAAVGAGRGRLVRQLLTESTLLAVAGGLLGIAFAWSTIDLLTLFVGRFTARTGEIAIDPQVLGFTLIVSMLTGVLFGTFPALSTRVDLVTALKESGKGAGAAGAHRRLQAGLIVVQVAVSVILLVGAGLLLASFYKLQQVDPGYRTERVLSAEAFGNFSKYPTPESLLGFYLPLLERLEQQPGVVSVAVTNAVPLSGIAPGSTPFQIEGRTSDSPDQRPTADVRIASPRYFETLGVPVLRGRVFNDLDHREAPLVALINRSMMRYWGDQDPIGSRISVNNGQTWLTVVGIVGDVRQFGLDQEAVAQVYAPLRQTPFGLAGRVLLRTEGDPVTAAGMLRQTIRQLDPEMPVENVTTLEDLRTTFLATPRLTATLLAIFAGLALFVTLAGITGVIATSVSERTQEFGIRIALGARPTSVLRMVLGQGMALVVAGLVIGLGGSLLLTRVLGGLLFEIEPTDPATLVGVSMVLLAVAAAACFIPARRATLVQPIIALRS
jgi:putative ABC transport system permease protein